MAVSATSASHSISLARVDRLDSTVAALIEPVRT